jgi:hypothetical protein
MTHAQHARQAAIYRAEKRSCAMPLRSFDPRGNLILSYPTRTYTITPEGRIA